MDELEGLLNICGTVETVIYENGENGYCVLRVRSTDGEEVTVVGYIPEATVGEQISAFGTWQSHPSYGDQFKAETVERSLPSGREGIFEFLASGAVKGIGAALAASIVGKFGEASLDILGSEPERLAEIKGISLKKAREIGNEFRRRAGMRTLMEFLAEHKMDTRLAVKLFRCYGDMALEMLSDNPYIITQEYFGADFYEADALAMSMGYDSNSRQRTEAAVLFELRHNVSNGHTFLPSEKLIDAVIQLIGVSEDDAADALDVLCECGHVVRETVAGRDACYLESIYTAEAYTAEKLLLMTELPTGVPANVGRIIEETEREQGIEYAALQREAVRLAAENRVLVLTGGPGTGKTTTLRGILGVFDRMKLETALTAPTGRAAKRMSELCSRKAYTVHRLLGASFSDDGEGTVFEHDEDNLLTADAIILDESSMIDVLLMEALLRAIKPTCRLVLVGDVDQLPSVGPGNVFSDVIRSGRVPVVRLTEIFRQAETSNIIKFAHMINGGETPEFTKNKIDFFFMRRQSPERTAETIVELCSKRLPERTEYTLPQIQVLSPTKKNAAGTRSLNKCIQAAVNPPDKAKNEIKGVDFTFREGDRVMQIRNDYDIVCTLKEGGETAGVYNGDVGVISEINIAAETVTVDFDDRTATYNADNINEIEPAYAVTVHKSQGSEYDVVVLSLMPASPMLMTRSILYTAVTRAKKMIVIVGDEQTACEMIANDRRQKRYSGLKTRLCNG